MPDTEIAFLVDRFVRRLHVGLNTRAPDFDTYKLGPGGGFLLLTLAEFEPIRMHDLVTRMARDKSQMTRAIKTLETKGLVRRSGDPDDARVWVLALTDEGHGTVDVLKNVVADVLSDVLAPLTGTEQTNLKAMLQRIE